MIIMINGWDKKGWDGKIEGGIGYKSRYDG
jgi:hypothetical protein